MPPDAPASADQTLDCSGLTCPLPVIKTRKALQELAVGQVLKVISTDPAAILDLQAWTRKTGQELLSYEEAGNVYTFYIRRAH